LKTARRLILAFVAALVTASLWPAMAQVIPGGPFSASGGGMPYPALFSLGTAAAPSVAPASQPNTGIYWGTNSTFLTANAVSSLVVGSSRVGIRRALQLTWTNSSTDPNTTAVFSMGADGTAGVTGALRVFDGTTPTQSGTTCGTGPTITGNNTLGSVTLGTTPGLPCTIVFNGTWNQAPRCFLNADVLTTATTTVRATGMSTSQFVITSSAALVATDRISWWCVAS
jgi:hypothetical protein